jgi:hypothetical protein
MNPKHAFSNHTFLIATPDGIETIPGTNLRGAAILMYKRFNRTGGASLYAKPKGATYLIHVTYSHKLEGLEDGRHFHRADLDGGDPSLQAQVHWQDAKPHEYKLVAAQKLDGAPQQLYEAVCNCGTYRSGVRSRAAADNAGAQHVRDKNSQETTS